MVIIGGLVIVGLGSMGNSIIRSSLIFAVISLAPVIYFITKSFTFGTSPSDYGNEIHRAYALSISIVVGAVYLVIRVRDISYVYIIPKKFFRNRMNLERMFVGAQVHAEAAAKQAASHKTNRMMKNAYEVSLYAMSKSERIEKPTSQSILAYLKDDWDLERKGGYVQITPRLRRPYDTNALVVDPNIVALDTCVYVQ